MNRVYFHKKRSISLNNLLLYLLLVFVLFGIYQNGIKIRTMGIYNMLKPTILFVLTTVISFITGKLNKEKIISERLVTNMLMYSITLCNVNIILYIVMIFIFNITYKYLKFNVASLYMTILIFVSMILKKYNFYNALEYGNKFNYNVWNYLLGRGPSGICNGFIILIIISLIVLSFKDDYKKELAYGSILAYYIFAIISAFITGFNKDLLCNANVLFALVFILPINSATPYTEKGMYIYSFLAGILVFASSYIDINVGVYIVVFVLSISANLVDKCIIYKQNKEEKYEK